MHIEGLLGRYPRERFYVVKQQLYPRNLLVVVKACQGVLSNVELLVAEACAQCVEAAGAAVPGVFAAQLISLICEVEHSKVADDLLFVLTRDKHRKPSLANKVPHTASVHNERDAFKPVQQRCPAKCTDVYPHLPTECIVLTAQPHHKVWCRKNAVTCSGR